MTPLTYRIMTVQLSTQETPEQINLKACNAFGSGQWDKAENAYIELVNLYAEGSIRPADDIVGLCEVLNQLGICAIRQNRLEDALSCFQSAIEHDPKDWRAFTNIGQIFKVVGNQEDATSFFQQAVELAPQASEPVNALCAALENVGSKVAYISLLRTVILHQPNHPDAIRHLISGLLAFSKQSGGRAQLRRDNELATALYEEGKVFDQSGDYVKAQDCYLRSIQLCPERAETYFQLGENFNHQRDYDSAIACMRTVARLLPNDPAPLASIGFYMIKAERYEEAEVEFKRAYKMDPKSAMIPLQLGYIYVKNKAPLAKSKAYLMESLQNGGKMLFLYQLLGKTLCELGEVEQAIEILNAGYEAIGDPLIKVQSIMSLPSIYTSNAKLESYSRHYREGLAQFRLTTDKREPFYKAKIAPPFQIPYMGKNDRDAQRRLCELYCQIYPQLNWIAPHCAGGAHPQPPRASGKIKIGFISSYFRNHTIGHLNLGLVEDLDRDRFEVVVIRQPQSDAKTARYDAAADKTILIEGSLESIRNRIAAEKLDVLYYTDIGMESNTYMLSMARLAHVQTQTWGQPETSGSFYMDYFLSSKDLDIESAQDHYCEELIRFEQLNCYYRRPDSLTLPDRSHFGWSDDEHIYLCPQSLFKFFPDFDTIMGEILKRDPVGKVVLLEGTYPEWNAILKQRFAEKYPDEADRLVFYPRLSREDYTRINGVADVVIEPIFFGNGNSSYEAFSVDSLVVSMPSDFLRCRITYAQLKKMGVDELIVDTPEAYVDLAVKLANDKAYATRIRNKIAERKSCLYDDKRVLHSLEDFLIQAVDLMAKQ